MICQYHPLGLEEQYKHKSAPGTKQKVLDYQFKQVATTLIHDHYRVIPPEEPICWMWDHTQLCPDEHTLLGELLKRVLYFGRAESFCRFEFITGPFPPVNCRLSAKPEGGNPVLVALPNADLNLEALFSSTDGDVVSDGKSYRVRDLLKQRRIPPGTTWYYAQIPAKPRMVSARGASKETHIVTNVLQFAVGGRVYPPLSSWVKVTERFRGVTLKQLYREITQGRTNRYEQLSRAERERVSLMTGKDANGVRLTHHSHAYFLLWPDEYGQPTRLLCWRPDPFRPEEITSLLKAAENTYSWEATGNPDWTVRLVPLPSKTHKPPGFSERSRTWESSTPFVLPGQRHRFRRGGRLRPGETAESLLPKLLLKAGFPVPKRIELIDHPNDSLWIRVHESQAERRARKKERSNTERPGYYYRLVFSQPVRGPICLGHSSHFGLGLFLPSRTAET